MEQGWVIAYTTRQMYEAKIFTQVLIDHNIPSHIINKMDTAYQTFGDIEIYVPDTQILQARELAKEFEAN